MEGFYRTDHGQQVNNDVEQRQLSAALKYQFTPQDTVYLQVKQYHATSGDLFQYYNPTNANPGVRVSEDQNPIVGLGYHHDWSPGVHTLLFAARLEDSLAVTNPTEPTLLAFARRLDTITSVQGVTLQQQYHSDLTIYSGELQQIWQTPEHKTILGTRIQYGDFDTHNLQTGQSDLSALYFQVRRPMPRNSNSLHCSSAFPCMAIINGRFLIPCN